TEILFAIGAGDKVVGDTVWCDYPPEARELPHIGDFSNVDIEKVASLDPDLIIATGLEQERIVKQLERLEVPVVVFFAGDIESALSSFERIGALVNEEENAAVLVTDLRDRLDEAKSKNGRIPDGERVSLFLEVSNEPLMTVSDGSFVDDMITIAGAENVGAGLPRPYSRIDPESVIAANPDVIIIAHSAATAETVENRPGWSEMSAVKNDRVYDGVDEDILFRAGPRFIEGIELVYSICYESESNE
ncbi:MAG: cobalamin-binding protein, partial [bacterium]|nr:cobalamin-binding protein [bacterium]